MDTPHPANPFPSPAVNGILKTTPHATMITTMLPHDSAHRLIILLAIATTFTSAILPPPAQASAATPATWQATLQFHETSGSGNALVFGKNTNASDDLDANDQPEPPAPPIAPFLRTWFTTDLPLPYTDLLQEFKNATTETSTWNISILWLPEADNATTTTITLTWDPANLTSLHACILTKGNATVADMLTQHTYSFQADTRIQHLQIKAQNNPEGALTPSASNTQTGFISIPVAIASLITIILLITLVMILYRRKRK